MATLFGSFPFLKTLFADSGYQGPKFRTRRCLQLVSTRSHSEVKVVFGFAEIADPRSQSFRPLLTLDCRPSRSDSAGRTSTGVTAG